MTQDATTFVRLARNVAPDGRLVSVRPLAGGSTATVWALAIAHPDGTSRTCVARGPTRDALLDRPTRLRDEYAVLMALAELGVPVPPPLHVDSLDEGAPYLVIEYMEGKPAFGGVAPNDAPDQLAAFLARLHATDWRAAGLGFLPRLPAPAMGGATVLLHGDYWPGNTIWKDGKLRAVIDWEDAALGDPRLDVGNARLELLWACGEAAVERFTAAYRRANPAVDPGTLAPFDLAASDRLTPRIGEWGLEPAEADRRRALAATFVASARAGRT